MVSLREVGGGRSVAADRGRSGAWFSYDSIRIGQGRENSKTYLKENPEVMARLEAAIP